MQFLELDFFSPHFPTYMSLQCVCAAFSAMCRTVTHCDPQGVTHVMIQTFQLSSCTLCNAPIQDVSKTHECGLFCLWKRDSLLLRPHTVFSIRTSVHAERPTTKPEVALCYQQISNLVKQRWMLKMANHVNCICFCSQKYCSLTDQISTRKWPILQVEDLALRNLYRLLLLFYHFPKNNL